MKTTWDLTQFYSSENDPQIQKDIEEGAKAVQAFVNKYKGATNYLKNEMDLFVALSDYEDLVEVVDAPKPLIYFYLRKYLNSSDQIAEANLNKLSDFYTKLENEVLFFDLELGKIPVERQKQFLKSAKLEHFHYYLKTIFDNAKHHLSEKEEQIMNLKSLPSSELWVNGGDKILNKQVVKFKGKELPLSEAIGQIPTLDSKNRRRLYERVIAVLKNVSDYSENELNAIVINKKINDELRHFENPYDARFLDDEVTKDEVLAMVDAVTENFGVSHKFYDLKFKLLKIRKPQYPDRSVEYGSYKKRYSYTDSVSNLYKIYEKIDNGFPEILERFTEKGLIDVKSKKGKSDGAFCLGTIGNPTFVLLNHIDNYDSFRTFAHEMGHAIHSELSKSETPLYQYYSTVTAETASTLFEDLAFDYVLEKSTDEEKKILIHSKLNNEISTIFRQVALFNFEKEMHSQIREKGFLSKEDIAKLMNKHMAAYLGEKFELKDDDGYYFVNWSHIRTFFYTYSYSYGRLISRVLFTRYKEDPSYFSEIKKFLSAGGSKSPHDIFAEIGIDTYDPNLWKEGIKSIESEIEEFGKLMK